MKCFINTCDNDAEGRCSDCHEKNRRKRESLTQA